MNTASQTARELFLRLWRRLDIDPDPQVPEDVRPLWDARPTESSLPGVAALGQAMRRMK